MHDSQWRSLLAVLALAGCAGDKPADDSAAPDDSATPADDSAPPDDSGLPAASQDLCDRLIAGPAESAAAPLGLSQLHAEVRLFGPHEDFVTPDEALISALSAGYASPDLAGYADDLDLCLLDAAAPLGEASVRSVGSLAWITPGIGEIALPAGATGVVVDLRGLPEDPALEQALRAALSPALASAVPPLTRKVRRWYGFVDQVYSSSNAYKTSSVSLDDEEIAASGAEDLPLVVVTDAQLAPSAARVAITLAVAGRAWVVGEDLMARVAEQRWAAVGDQGVMFTAAWLDGDGVEVPDTVPATERSDDPEALLSAADLSTWAAPSAPTGETIREKLPLRDPYDEPFDAERSTAEVYEAGLIIAHGVLRSFYPYFSVVGDEIDDRLIEVLGTPAADREAQRRNVGRLGNALSDGHMFFGDYYRASPAGYLPVTWDLLDGRPVIVHSLVEGLETGDTITAIDGEPIEDLLAELMEWHGGATLGYRLDVAARDLNVMQATTTYTVEAADGTTREQDIEPQPVELYYEAPFVYHTRANGWLDDLGAAGVAYVNLDFEVSTDITEIKALISEAASADGLVIDMRGYPGVNHYEVVEALSVDLYTSPWFDVWTWRGPFSATLDADQYEYPASGLYTGPLVVLTSPITVSAAENFSMMLVDRPDTTFVGRQSAGTNGNITGMRLPGGFYLMFTGMEVLFPDGGAFHGTGIVPDVEVIPTAQDYADGVDPELETAVELLLGG